MSKDNRPRWHTNPITGKSSICSSDPSNPRSRGCDFDLKEDEHSFSREDAEARFAKIVNEPLIPVITGSSDNRNRKISSNDESLMTRISRVQSTWRELDPAQKGKHLDDLFKKYDDTSVNLHNMEYGSRERVAALNARKDLREEIFANDIVAWRDSEFYNEDVEDRMRKNAIFISDADLCIEKALTDRAGISELAKRNGMSTRDVENILETIHDDYLKVRLGLTKGISELSKDSQYTETTAHIFRLSPEAIKGVISFASKKSKVAA